MDFFQTTNLKFEMNDDGDYEVSNLQGEFLGYIDTFKGNFVSDVPVIFSATELHEIADSISRCSL